MASRSPLSFRELQQLCSANRDLLPEYAVCRGKGLTKVKLTEMLQDVGIINKKGVMVTSKGVKKHTKNRTSVVDDKEQTETESSDVEKHYTFRELQKICSANKGVLPDGTNCGGKGVTRESLYILLLEAQLLGELKGEVSEDKTAKKAVTNEGSFFINEAVCASVSKDIPIERLLLGQHALQGKDPTKERLKAAIPSSSHPIQYILVYAWFIGKKGTSKRINEEDKKIVKVPPSVQKFMTRFVEKFWKYGLTLEIKKELKGTGFNRHKMLH